MLQQEISDQLNLLSKLMDIHGENSFKSKAYSSAAFALDKLTIDLKQASISDLAKVKGIGQSVAEKIKGIVETGTFPLLLSYIEKTPPGILEMLQIKGIGPKKIATIWKELEIEDIASLLYACYENRLVLYKGFGEKTQSNIQASIEFYLNSQGKFLYADLESTVQTLQDFFTTQLKDSSYRISPAGSWYRQDTVIEELSFITDMPIETLLGFLKHLSVEIKEQSNNYVLATAGEGLKIRIESVSTNEYISSLFVSSCSESFLNSFKSNYSWQDGLSFNSEQELFEFYKAPYRPPFLREFYKVQTREEELVTTSSIRGIIHSHSQWSDGTHSLEEMAKAAKAQGFEYLVISDHSKSAFYANGLQVERVYAQHEQINELNEKLAPFKIFKSIECDILTDGSLDYDKNVLEEFDLVIASIHSNLKMNEEKATDRLLKAIENPYTNILGHMTGRLLLGRAGYPIQHEKIIDACAKNRVVIELNAHPRRLDIDWTWIPYALDKGVTLSINPDAHSIEGFKDIQYGVKAGRKGHLTISKNLSSYSLLQMEQFIEHQHEKRD